MAQSRNEKKLVSLRRAQFNLQVRLDRIDWELDVLLPEVEALREGTLDIEAIKPVVGELNA